MSGVIGGGPCRSGYISVQEASRTIAQRLARQIGAMDDFTLWNDGSDIPVFAWRMAEGHTGNWTPSDLSDRTTTDPRH